MTFRTVAHTYVRDRDYTVYISICIQTAQLHIFKYNESLYSCEYEVCANPQDAQKYLEKRLDSV